MSVYDDPEVAPLKMHETIHEGSHINVLGFTDAFVRYLDRGLAEAKHGRRGHASYASLKAALFEKSPRAYAVFIQMAELRRSQTDIAIDLGVSTRRVRQLLKVAKDMGLDWKDPAKGGCKAPLLNRDEERVKGMVEAGFSLAVIAQLQGRTEDQVRAVIDRARDKKKGKHVEDEALDLTIAAFSSKNTVLEMAQGSDDSSGPFSVPS